MARTRVLVVDDDTAMREMMALALGKEGFEVRAAASSRAAEDAVSESPFEVIVTDIYLGDGAFGLQDAARGSFGASMQHSPDVSTFLEYRGINNFAPDSAYISDSLLAGGVNYRISKTYSASFVPTYDLRENDFRLFTMNLQRELPDMTLFATFGYDAIQDQYFGGLNIAIGGARTPAGLLSSQSSLFASPDIDR